MIGPGVPQVSPVLRDVGILGLPHPCRVLCDRVGALTSSPGVPHVSPVLRDVGILGLPHPCRVLCDRVGKELPQFPRLLQHHARIARFIAVLQQGASGCGKFSRRGEQGLSIRKATGIEDGVEARKRNHVLASLSVFGKHRQQQDKWSPGRPRPGTQVPPQPNGTQRGSTVSLFSEGTTDTVSFNAWTLSEPVVLRWV